jgi:hypothetical protein
VSTRQIAGPERVGSPEWLRLARRARMLSWLTLGWLGFEAAVGVAAAVIAGSVALLGFGLDSGIEALASIIVIWRFTGSRLVGPLSERRAQKLVASASSCWRHISRSRRSRAWRAARGLRLAGPGSC